MKTVPVQGRVLGQVVGNIEPHIIPGSQPNCRTEIGLVYSHGPGFRALEELRFPMTECEVKYIRSLHRTRRQKWRNAQRIAPLFGFERR